MHVTVRLSGPLAARLGNRIAVELEPGACVADLLAVLTLDGEADGRAADVVAVVAGGTIVSREHALAAGDEIDVLVPVAGG
ncbi:MAG: MoaD/ThiS family protein [Gaiella sp.]|nr:MoaD/ThiS family protein [Gaiella sp.]